jgi:hypothetical protein
MQRDRATTRLEDSMNRRPLIIAASLLLVTAIGTPAAAQSIRKDRNGYIQNDPAVEAFLRGKNTYFSTDFDLYRTILRGYDYKPFQVAKVILVKTADKLKFTLVEQSKRPGEVIKNDFEYTKVNEQFYQAQYTSAILQKDGSIMLCSSIRGELLSKNEQATARATKADLVKQCLGYLAQMKTLRDAGNAQVKRQKDEAFFTTGVKAVKRNAALEGKFLRVLNAANAGPGVAAADRVSYQRVLLIFTDWEVQKNDAGRPIKQVYAAWAIGRFVQSKECFFHKVYLKKDHLGGGRYSDVRFDEAQSPSRGSCDIIK